jgi:hypothetical protein
VSDYGLDDRSIGVRSPAGTKDFSSILCVQTCSGAHPASCPKGTVGPFPGGGGKSHYRHAGANGERRYSCYSFLTLVVVGVSGQHHAPAALYPRERTPGTHCTGGWVGHGAGLG